MPAFCVAHRHILLPRKVWVAFGLSIEIWHVYSILHTMNSYVNEATKNGRAWAVYTHSKTIKVTNLRSIRPMYEIRVKIGLACCAEGVAAFLVGPVPAPLLVAPPRLPQMAQPNATLRLRAIHTKRRFPSMIDVRYPPPSKGIISISQPCPYFLFAIATRHFCQVILPICTTSRRQLG